MPIVIQRNRGPSTPPAPCRGASSTAVSLTGAPSTGVAATGVTGRVCV